MDRRSVFPQLISALFLLLTLLLVPACRESSAQEPAPDAEPAVAFPASWAGRYEGDLSIHSAGGRTQTVPMSIEIAGTDDPARFRWVIRYGGQPARNYTLVTKDAGKRAYEIDEGNSIVLPATLLGDELISEFAVMGNRITSVYRKTAEGLEMNMLTTTAEATVSTGGEGRTPRVAGFGVQNRQRAVLLPAPAVDEDR